MFRKYAFIGVFSILAGCETFSGMERDIDNLIALGFEDDNVIDMPVGKATKSPEILPSPHDRTGIIIEKPKKHSSSAKKSVSKPSKILPSAQKTAKKPDVKKVHTQKPDIQKPVVSNPALKKTVQKPITTTSIPKQSKLSATRQALSKVKKNPICRSHDLKKLKNVSELYHFFYKKPKQCHGHDYHDAALPVYQLLISQRYHQDIRLLNADHGFAQFTKNIIRFAPDSVHMKGASILKNSGCGLMSREYCKNIIVINSI